VFIKNKKILPPENPQNPEKAQGRGVGRKSRNWENRKQKSKKTEKLKS
jgi:hypothetical protein